MQIYWDKAGVGQELTNGLKGVGHVFSFMLKKKIPPTPHINNDRSLTIEIQNLSFNEKDWNQVPGIRNPWSGIWNPKTIFSILDSFPWGDMSG